jgi:hypothetical protein
MQQLVQQARLIWVVAVALVLVVGLTVEMEPTAAPVS